MNEISVRSNEFTVHALNKIRPIEIRVVIFGMLMLR